MNISKEDREYWEEMALELPADRNKSLDRETVKVPGELEDMLWALAEGRLNVADESRLWKLAAQHPGAATRLSQIQLSLLAADELEQRLDSKTAWSRIEHKWADNSAGMLGTIRDLVLEIAARGLDIIQSTGQAAYAPAVARSDQDAPATSVAQQYLTSIGTVRVTIDWRKVVGTDDYVCDASLEPLVLSPRISRDDLVVELRDGNGNSIDRSGFQDNTSKFSDLRSGNYAAIFFVAQNEEARLLIELRPA